MMDHQEAIDTLAAERYLLGEMTNGERDAFEAHFFSCTECSDDVRGSALMKDGVRAGLLDVMRRPAIARGFSWRPAIAIPWAAAATLAIVAGYESVHSHTHVAGGPIALAPVTLQPETRGQEPAVAPGPEGAVTLAIPLQSSNARSIHYELMSGKLTIASGDVSPPAAGAPLLLMIPSGLLNPGSHYELVVKGPGSSDLTAEQYRFRVEGR